MEKFRNLNKPIPRVDGIEKVTGQAKYTDDFTLPRMLYGKVLRSPYPHAKILRSDTSRAERLPGVRAVLTGKDNPEGRMGLIFDRPILAADEVRFVGEAVAMVAADTTDIAEEALDLIEVEYEELPAVLDMEEAMKPHPARVVQPGHHLLPVAQALAGLTLALKAAEETPNIYQASHLAEGDVEQGFRESDVVIENRYEFKRTQHCAMEPHCAMARPEPDGGFTVWASEQHPFEAQLFLSRIFKLPVSKVRVIVPYVGGAFGGKLFVMGMPYAMMLAQRTGRPVKVLYGREEVFVDGYTDVPMVVYVKDGVKKDGRLWARKLKAVVNCGAYAGRVLLINSGLVLNACMNYRVPHFYWDSYCVATNEPPSGSHRGFGGVQIIHAVESNMDMLARAIGMDPYEFRRMNLYRDGEINLAGITCHSVETEECLDKVAGWIGWSDKPKKREQGPWRIGRGIAAQGKGAMITSYSQAEVKVHADGTVELRQAATEVGQGCHTVLAAIAAEEFQTSVDKVRLITADTAVTPYDITSTANITTFNAGNAVRKACQDAKRQIFEIAAERLKARPELAEGAKVEDLGIRDGLIYVKGKGEGAMKLGDIFVPGGGGTVKRGEIIGHGVFLGPDWSPEELARVMKKAGWRINTSHGALALEAAVNVETGEVKVLRMAQCHDMGTPLNTKACEGQIEGGTGFGMGRALYEHLVIENGVAVNPNFVDYKLPSLFEVPLGEGVVVTMLPTGVPHKDGPYGGKGFGESTSDSVSPAVAAALYDAAGIRLQNLPITREKVLEALEQRS